MKSVPDAGGADRGSASPDEPDSPGRPPPRATLIPSPVKSAGGVDFDLECRPGDGTLPSVNEPAQGGPDDALLVAEVRAGDVDRFEELIRRHQSRVFGTVRRYARHESEVEDIVQDVFIKAFSRLDSWRGDAPFEHWLMRLTVRTCFDALRVHQRSREHVMTDLTDEEASWIDRYARAPESRDADAAAARTLVQKVLEQMSPASRLILTLLEIEDRSVKEIAELTGWSTPVIKVRAFRARAEMKKLIRRMKIGKYL